MHFLLDRKRKGKMPPKRNREANNVAVENAGRPSPPSRVPRGANLGFENFESLQGTPFTMMGFKPLALTQGKAAQIGSSCTAQAALLSVDLTKDTPTVVNFVHSFGRDVHPTIKYQHYFFLFAATSAGDCGYVQVPIGDGKGTLVIDFSRKVMKLSSSTLETVTSFEHDVVLSTVSPGGVVLGVSLYATGSELLLRS